MNRSGWFRRPAPSPLRRAHRSLEVLIVISILAAGGLSAAASAPPSPMTGLSFALSAVLLAAAGMLAARVVIALERARRAARPPIAPLATDFPVMSRLLNFRRRDRASSVTDRSDTEHVGAAGPRQGARYPRRSQR